MDNLLIEKIGNKKAVIGVIGLGYVGLPLTLAFADAGFRVLGFDIDKEKVQKLNAGSSYIEQIPPDRIASALEKGFEASQDFSRCAEADAIILCVPTPLNRHREPDLTYILNTVDTILPFLRSGQIIALESTTYPGTTEEELLPRLETTGHKVGKDLFLVYSPEREDPGNTRFSLKNTPKICGGITDNCLAVGVALYSRIVGRVVPVSSTRAAEMTKLLENIHRAVNIGLVNEMKIVADKMGIDIHEVINAAATKPFGFVPYKPGPGLGGHCIPIDPFYLTWKAREYGINTHFIELAGEVNSRMPEWVVKKLSDALNEKEKAVKGSRLLVLGIAYKKNVDDTRESPGVTIIELLAGKGAVVDYSDPHVPVFPKMRDHKLNLKSVSLTPENIRSYDGIVLVADHDAFDYNMIRTHAKLVVDTRGMFTEPFEALVRA